MELQAVRDFWLIDILVYVSISGVAAKIYCDFSSQLINSDVKAFIAYVYVHKE